MALSDHSRHDRAAHAGGRRRGGDRLLDGLGRRPRPTYPDHRGIEVPMDAARQRLFGRLRLHQDRRRGPSAGRARRRRRDHPALPAAHAGRDRGAAVAGRSGAAPRAYFDPLGYRGYFVHGRASSSRSTSSRSQTMQNQSNLPDLTAPLTQRQRFGRYIYNFIFLPPARAGSTRARSCRSGCAALADSAAPARRRVAPDADRCAASRSRSAQAS